LSEPSRVSRALHTLADLAEIRGDIADAAEYRETAVLITTFPPAEAAARSSPRLRSRVRELTKAREDAILTSARASLPRLYRALLDLSVVDTNEAAMLVRRLEILTLPELQHALEAGRIVEAFDEHLDARLRQAAPAIRSDAGAMPLGRARDILETLSVAISACSPSLEALTASGEVRRYESLVSELILVGRSSEPLTAIEQVCLAKGVEVVLHRSARRAVVTTQRTEVDIRVAAPGEYGTVLFSTTGSQSHARQMRQRGGPLTLAPQEEDLYARAGLPYIAPELRQGTGEVEAAISRTLPRLVSVEDMKGDLHMHTIASDGADTLDAMVEASCALGYQYIAITDHSERAGASRTVSRRELSRQRAEIEAVRERFPQITILHGIEVDIMPDGSLDFPDRVLESLDIVLASLHDSARQDGKTLTRRCLQAIRHPLVTVITHPANRLVGRRAGYPLDYDAIFAAAAETGTALEVDGAPSHLDLEGERAREAIAAGVTLTIDSDCHRARWLERQMQMGVGTARRGWVEPRHVLNTRSIDDVRAFIAAKRRRR
jgi:DNA polymerase (family X)